MCQTISGKTTLKIRILPISKHYDTGNVKENTNDTDTTLHHVEEAEEAEGSMHGFIRKIKVTCIVLQTDISLCCRYSNHFGVFLRRSAIINN